MNARHILVVDDEAGIRDLLKEILQDEGYQVTLAENATQARQFRKGRRPDLVLLDIWMPDFDGVSLLKEWAGHNLLTMPVIMMSGHGTIDTAVEATRLGAFDFLEKPIALQKLLTTIERAFREHKGAIQHYAGLARLSDNPVYAPLARRLTQIAEHRTPFLLMGETGSGAELCARFLRQQGKPFVAPDTTAWLAYQPLDLLAEAQNGLLFLPEIGNLNRLEQKGLLLMFSKIEKFNVQLITATTRQLSQLVDAGQFDANLFNSLTRLVLTLPSLRQHRGEIPSLAQLILTELIEQGESPPRRFSPEALSLLRDDPWPVTLSQLYNVIKTLGMVSLREQISLHDVTQTLLQFKDSREFLSPPLPLDLPLRDARDAFEKIYFEHHIQLAGGNMSKVAEKIGLERTHLYRKLKKLGVNIGKAREES
ncbi:MAG: sigma-54 dependent transcriptional regulator [Proteobacteria bacterium]|nr:sigma-54 dependent transcriptional regulator [Pseudomonadota bacterium]MDE3208742.1 sigma-54-dependent Fis family transcriptional regulator [Pseudomonadota bacterium]